MSQKPLDLKDRLALTVAEAAEAIGVSERHLRRMLSEIPHVRVGGRVLIPIDEFRRWLRERSQAGPSKVNRTAEEILDSLGTP